MELALPICSTCGVQYSRPRDNCPICLDERQYVGWDGQQWTTLAELQAAGHRGRLASEGPGVDGIGADPPTAIGQRALLARAPGGNVLWDMITYIDDDLIARVGELGGVSAIAVSHPHFYGSMIEFCDAFDAPVYIHAKDRKWVARPHDAVVFWEGDTLEIGDGLTLINAGVHFDGGQVLHWAARPGRQGRSVLRRHIHGGPGSSLGQLHVQLPEPHSGAPGLDPPRAGPDRTVSLRPRLRRVVAPRRCRRRRRRGAAISGAVPSFRAGRRRAAANVMSLIQDIRPFVAES